MPPPNPTKKCFLRLNGRSINFTNTSNSFIVTGPPQSLSFTNGPTDTSNTSPLGGTTGLVVQLYDQDGNPVNLQGVLVTLRLSPTGVKLNGITSVRTNMLGQAIFTNVVIGTIGSSYSLMASSANMFNAFSDPFNIFQGVSRWG